jgi:hypothetical protein
MYEFIKFTTSTASAQNNIRQFEPAQSSPWSGKMVIQEQRLMLWEVAIPVTESKKVHKEHVSNSEY